MSVETVQLSDPGLLAEYAPLETVKGLAQRRYAVSPDLLAMVIRDGRVVSAEPGGNLELGGLWQGVRDALFGKHALSLVVADLKPFPVVAGVNALSRDHVPVAGELTLELQVNPERASNVLGLMHGHGAVHKAEVFPRLAPHLGDRVIEHVVGQVDARDLRGAREVQDKVQADILREVERIAGDLGLMVRAVSLRWEINPEEIAAIAARERAREQERRDAELAALQREVARESEITALEIRSEIDAERVQAAGDDELRRMLFDQELAFEEARDTGRRITEMTELHHEIDKLRTERTAEIEARIEGAQTEVEVARLRNELREVQRQTERLDREQALQLDRLEKLQELEIAREAHRNHVETLSGLQGVDLSGKRAEVEIEASREDAAARRARETREADAAAEIEKLRVMGGMSPELVLAINAGVSPAVAEVLKEQARAKGGDAEEKMALMREQIAQAKEARLDSAEQARHFFETGMRGNAEVARAAAGGGAGAAEWRATSSAPTPNAGAPCLLARSPAAIAGSGWGPERWSGKAISPAATRRRWIPRRGSATSAARRCCAAWPLPNA